MRELELSVRELLATAQQERRKAKLARDAGRVNTGTVFRVGVKVGGRVLVRRTKARGVAGRG
jgi:hypothetical protein